jgi:thioredoxin reductase (NADPH)
LNTEIFDCLVIGGGPAGLVAATYLRRFHREVLVVDAGDSRAKAIPVSHNYPGFANGIAGPELLRKLSTQARQYGATITHGRVSDLMLGGDGFCGIVEGRQVIARRVLVATGLKDNSPKMPCLRESVAQAVLRYCPICDGFEATDRNIGVYGPVMAAESKAVFLRTYSRSVTLLPVETNVDAPAIKRMHEAGITLAPSVPVNFRAGDGDVSVELQNGDHLQFDALYPELGCKVHSDLASNLGARCNDVGCLEVDQKQQTSIEGIYAAGDVVSDLHQLAVAAGHAAIAATAIHRSLPTNFR